jgi:AraC-like DNA-binding protein
MSRTAFAVRFNELVGEPPLRYVARCRMRRAVALLRKSTATLPQIAERVGYESEVSFSRAFRRHLGMSPAAYRRSGRGRDDGEGDGSRADRCAGVRCGLRGERRGEALRDAAQRGFGGGAELSASCSSR